MIVVDDVAVVVLVVVQMYPARTPSWKVAAASAKANGYWFAKESVATRSSAGLPVDPLVVMAQRITLPNQPASSSSKPSNVMASLSGCRPSSPT